MGEMKGPQTEILNAGQGHSTSYSDCPGWLVCFLGREDHWVLASNVVRYITGSELVLIPTDHLGQVQGVTKRDSRLLTVPMFLVA